MDGATPLPAGTVTFLFTDIEGSTRLWEQHPEPMREALARHDALLRRVIEANGGAVFKTVGDAFCAAFATVPAAVTAALAVQRTLKEQSWGVTGPLRVRAALHTGAVESREGDYFGPPLNRVARVLSAGHGGQILLSVATQELARDHLPDGVMLRELGEHRLKDLVRPERIFQIVAPDLPAEFAPLRTLDSRAHNLPVQRAALIGREREVAAAQEILRRDDVGLLTLTGAGGTGKTRLGLQVAAELIDIFADGVFLVSLAPISDPSLVLSAIAQTLGVRETEGRGLADSLKEHLREKQMLLLLDNFEQVTAAAPLVAELLVACPHLKLLVTSRHVLHLSGEHEFPVPPLTVPDPRQLPSLDRLAQYEAVRLFIERAQAVKPDFAVNNENAPAVAAICQRLDGLPLAIELAAARIRLLPPKALLTRLERRLALLTGGAVDLPARQQTLRGAIAWSYDLLDGGEKTLFRRLGVFVGGFTLEAAEAVAGAGSWDSAVGELNSPTAPISDSQLPAPIDVLDGVASLVEKSLLKQVTDDEAEEPRFGMLETVREFAGECLAASGEEAAIRRLHARSFLELAEQAETGLQGAAQAEWLDRLEREHDNLRAALGWLAETGDAGPALRMGGALWRFWHVRGHLREGRRRLEAVLAMPGAAGRTLVRARALNGAGALAHDQGDAPRAALLHEEGLAIARECGDQETIAYSLLSLGNVALDQQEYEQAKRLYEEALAIWRSLGNRSGVARLLNNLGMIAQCLEDREEAIALFEESLTIKRELGTPGSIASTLNNLGELALDRGDYERAAALLDESLRLYLESGSAYGISMSLNNLARMAQEQGEPERAARLLAVAAGLRDSTGAQLSADFERNIALTRAALGEERFGTAWSLGLQMTPEQAIDGALHTAALT